MLLLRYLYLHGPACLGFYEGLPITEVCARLTNVDETVWKMVPHACDGLVDNKVHALEIALLYAVVPIVAVKWAFLGLSLLPRLVTVHAFRKYRKALVGASRLPLERLDTVT